MIKKNIHTSIIHIRINFIIYTQSAHIHYHALYGVSPSIFIQSRRLNRTKRPLAATLHIRPTRMSTFRKNAPHKSGVECTDAFQLRTSSIKRNKRESRLTHSRHKPIHSNVQPPTHSISRYNFISNSLYGFAN